MTKRIASKDKICRRLGCNLWGRPKSAFNRREGRPGPHGGAHRKLSDYGTQLMAKQRLRGYYGNIGEKQFRNYYRHAANQKGDTAANLINLLERRLDTVVYRSKFALTVFSARQFISHGHVTVNGKRVMVASFLLSEGDVVAVRSQSRDLAIVIESQASKEREVPDYINLDVDKLAATFATVPSIDDIPYPVRMQPSLVVEYYSR